MTTQTQGERMTPAELEEAARYARGGEGVDFPGLARWLSRTLAHIAYLTPRTPEDVAQWEWAVSSELSREGYADESNAMQNLDRLRVAAARVPELEAQGQADWNALCIHLGWAYEKRDGLPPPNRAVCEIIGRMHTAESLVSELEVLSWDLVRVGVLMFEGAEERADSNARHLVRLAQSPTPEGLLEAVGDVLAVYLDLPVLCREQAAPFERLSAAYDAAKGGDVDPLETVKRAVAAMPDGPDRYALEVTLDGTGTPQITAEKARKYDAAVGRAKNREALLRAWHVGGMAPLEERISVLLAHLGLDTPPSGPGGGEPAPLREQVATLTARVAQLERERDTLAGVVEGVKLVNADWRARAEATEQALADAAAALDDDGAESSEGTSLADRIQALAEDRQEEKSRAEASEAKVAELEREKEAAERREGVLRSALVTCIEYACVVPVGHLEQLRTRAHSAALAALSYRLPAKRPAGWGAPTTTTSAPDVLLGAVAYAITCMTNVGLEPDPAGSPYARALAALQAALTAKGGDVVDQSAPAQTEDARKYRGVLERLEDASAVEAVFWDAMRKHAPKVADRLNGPEMQDVEEALANAIRWVVNIDGTSNDTPPSGPGGGCGNTCEHGDHSAPEGQRFCSPECQRCESASDKPEDEGCSGICGADRDGNCRTCGRFKDWPHQCQTELRVAEAVGPRITPVERLVDVARRLASGAHNRGVWNDLDAAIAAYDAAKGGETPESEPLDTAARGIREDFEKARDALRQHPARVCRDGSLALRRLHDRALAGARCSEDARKYREACARLERYPAWVGAASPGPALEAEMRSVRWVMTGLPAVPGGGECGNTTAQGSTDVRTPPVHFLWTHPHLFGYRIACGASLYEVPDSQRVDTLQQWALLDDTAVCPECRADVAKKTHAKADLAEPAPSTTGKGT